jgi:hypothetical protein
MKHAIFVLEDYSEELVEAITVRNSTSTPIKTICPVCRESVHLCNSKNHNPYFSHGKGEDKISRNVCEKIESAISYEDYLKDITSKSKNERFNLFEERIWDIFSCLNKSIKRMNFKQELARQGIMNETVLENTSYCLENWKANRIIPRLEEMDKNTKSEISEFVKSNPEVLHQTLEIDKLIDVSPLNIVIRNEVIIWINTRTPAAKSFLNKVVMLVLLKNASEMELIINQKVLYQVFCIIALVDWKEYIENLPKKQGFG